MKYVLTVAYDGFDYQGWQAQSHDLTVSAALTKAFKSAFHTDVRLIGASRTDSGVHAFGQVASVMTDLDLEPAKLKAIWNRRLPHDVHIRDLHYAADNFHPLKNVKQKTYYYNFFTERPLPREARGGLWCRRPIDIERLKKALAIFVGTHDFRSFCAGDDHKSTVRTIDEILVKHLKKNTYRIIIRGKSFLRYMIRRIVGAALYSATYPDVTVEKLKIALEKRDARQCLPVAEPHGLVLHKITYQTNNKRKTGE